MVGIRDQLRIEIVEHQNEVLPIILRQFEIGEDVALVRFDSFADLLVPKDIQADEIETLNHLVNSITNQNWILPAVYRGYIKKIFWFKPPWAHQFQDGKYHLQIGKCQQTGLLKVASTNPYFTSNCIYSSNEKLTNIQTVDIYVTTSGLAKNYSTIIDKSIVSIYDNDSGNENLNNQKTKSDLNHNRIYSLDATIINQLLENRPFILDINLAFFSTDDVVRKQFDENEYEILRFVYTRIVQDRSDSEIQQYIITRENTFKQIRTLMNEYITGVKADQQIFINDPYLAALIAIIRYKKLDWKLVHNYGMHLSDTRPPLHVSSEAMIIYLNESMARILQSIKKDPVLITISRCVDDGYCSFEQANTIQEYVENKINELYPIDQTNGKSLLKINDKENIRKARILSDDDNSPESSIPQNPYINEINKVISPSSLSDGSSM